MLWWCGAWMMYWRRVFFGFALVFWKGLEMVKEMKTSNILEEHYMKLYIGVSYAEDFAPRPRGRLLCPNFSQTGLLTLGLFFSDQATSFYNKTWLQPLNKSSRCKNEVWNTGVFQKIKRLT